MSDVNAVIADLSPSEVWKQFVAISAIPRCSKHEHAVSEYVIRLAKKHKLSWNKDEYGNIVVKKPATNASSRPLILQSHLDIVCESVPEKAIDMRTTPIQLRTDGMWVFADGTTLGADDGIGVSLMLAILDGNYAHPPLEALFTVDEETGLRGALQLDVSMLEGKRLINIDSDTAGKFCIGSAGGQTTHGKIPAQKGEAPADYVFFRIQVSGLVGGHSGVTIHEGRANAITLLARTLDQLPLCIADIEGGSVRHNAIPRDAHALVGIPVAEADNLKKRVAQRQKEFSQEFGVLEPQLTLSCTAHESPLTALDISTSERLIRLLLTIPSGMISQGRSFPGVTDSSSNLAGVWLKETELLIISSQRGVMDHITQDTGRVVVSAIAQAGGKSWMNEQYPAWTPQNDSELLTRLSSIYQDLHAEPPQQEIVHAGLECGVIRSRMGELDAVSIGATIQNMHSPDERVLVDSVGSVWQFLLAVLEKIDA